MDYLINIGSLVQSNEYCYLTVCLRPSESVTGLRAIHTRNKTNIVACDNEATEVASNRAEAPFRRNDATPASLWRGSTE